MSFLTRDILSFYNHNDDNSKYFKEHLSGNATPGFLKPFKEDPYKANPLDGELHFGIVDDNNTYSINSLGLRGNVYENSEIVASGCSVTFGVGVPELGRWTNILEEKINKDILNLGNTGASVQTICINLIEYCMNNRMPKEIFCLMPDFFRNMVVVDKEFYESRVKTDGMAITDELGYLFCGPNVIITKDYISMYVEDKKYIEDSVSPHQLILNSINYIYILESFCLTNNIKLNWTTWDLPTATILQELSKNKDFKLKNFLPLWNPDEILGFKSYTNLKCDLSHESEFRTNQSWPKGSDYLILNGKKKRERYHPGIHFQYHVADFFYDLYKKNNSDT
jgi:hypothetical protein